MICGTFGRALLGAAALAAIAAPASADQRLVERVYSEREVVRVDGRMHVQATIVFGDTETIENVAVGDAQSWQITPNKRANLLFVKPLNASARTNMTVITDRHRYFFDLVASPGARPMYMLRFAYNDAPARPASPGVPAQRAPGASSEARIAANSSPGDPATDPSRFNFAWKTSGDSRLLPQSIYDDGSATYLLWHDNQPVPAILVTNDKGDEGPVNYAVRGSTIVIADVPGTLILRHGRARAILRNDGRGKASNAGSRGAPARASGQGIVAASPALLTAPGKAGN